MHPRSFLANFWRTDVKQQVFVAMSFGEQYDARFEQVIRPAIESMTKDGIAYTACRVDRLKTGDSILTDIMDGIAHYALILADISTAGYDAKTGKAYRNSNVMYEVGIALTSRQPEEVLLIRDDHDSFLFDINTIPQHNIYFCDAAKAKATLVELMVDRLTSVSYFQNARVQMAVTRLTASELEFLATMDPVSSTFATVMPRTTSGKFNLDGRENEALNRLVDKTIISCSGKSVSGTIGYVFQLTEFGRIVAIVDPGNWTIG